MKNVKLDCHWVEKDSTAQATLAQQGYAPMDYRLGSPVKPGDHEGRRIYWVNMCKEIEG